MSRLFSNSSTHPKSYAYYSQLIFLFFLQTLLGAHSFKREIKYFEKALSLSRAQDWRTDNITPVFDEQNLHEFVGVTFASVLFKSAKAFIHSKPKLGIEQADRSIKCIAEGERYRKIVSEKKCKYVCGTNFSW